MDTVASRARRNLANLATMQMVSSATSHPPELQTQGTRLESSQREKRRPLLDFVVSFVTVAIAVLAAATGYYSSACPQSGDGPVWAIISVVLFPFMYPVTILLWPAMSLGLALAARPASSSWRFRRFCMVSVVAMPGLGIGGWALARMVSASERCSFGF